MCTKIEIWNVTPSHWVLGDCLLGSSELFSVFVDAIREFNNEVIGHHADKDLARVIMLSSSESFEGMKKAFLDHRNVEIQCDSDGLAECVSIMDKALRYLNLPMAKVDGEWRFALQHANSKEVVKESAQEELLEIPDVELVVLRKAA